MDCRRANEKPVEAPKAQASPPSKYKIVTFRWRQELRSYEALRCIDTVKGDLLEHYPSEEGDGKFDYELIVACAAKRVHLKQTTGYAAWYVTPWLAPDHRLKRVQARQGTIPRRHQHALPITYRQRRGCGGVLRRYSIMAESPIEAVAHGPGGYRTWSTTRHASKDLRPTFRTSERRCSIKMDSTPSWRMQRAQAQMAKHRRPSRWCKDRLRSEELLRDRTGG